MKNFKRSECAVLHLGIKRPWYVRIDSGEKRIEFREDSPYWRTRIINWLAKAVLGQTPVLEFQNGYSMRSPRMTFIAGNGRDLIYYYRRASDPVHHRDLGEFPKNRWCL